MIYTGTVVHVEVIHVQTRQDASRQYQGKADIHHQYVESGNPHDTNGTALSRWSEPQTGTLNIRSKVQISQPQRLHPDLDSCPLIPSPRLRCHVVRSELRPLRVVPTVVAAKMTNSIRRRYILAVGLDDDKLRRRKHPRREPEKPCQQTPAKTLLARKYSEETPSGEPCQSVGESDRSRSWLLFRPLTSLNTVSGRRMFRRQTSIQQ